MGAALGHLPGLELRVRPLKLQNAMWWLFPTRRATSRKGETCRGGHLDAGKGPLDRPATRVSRAGITNAVGVHAACSCIACMYARFERRRNTQPKSLQRRQPKMQMPASKAPKIASPGSRANDVGAAQSSSRCKVDVVIRQLLKQTRASFTFPSGGSTDL